MLETSQNDASLINLTIINKFWYHGEVYYTTPVLMGS